MAQRREINHIIAIQHDQQGFATARGNRPFGDHPLKLSLDADIEIGDADDRAVRFAAGKYRMGNAKTRNSVMVQMGPNEARLSRRHRRLHTGDFLGAEIVGHTAAGGRKSISRRRTTS